MTVFTKRAVDVFAPQDAGGAPRPVNNGEAQVWGTEIETIVSSGYEANYATRAELYADLAHPAGALGRVFGDGTAAYNGVYKKSGASGAGSWTKIGDLPDGDLSAIEADLATEVAAREAADTAEATARTAADGTLQSNIDAEATARAAADSEISIRSIGLLAGVGGTANAITVTAQDPAVTQMNSRQPFWFTPAVANTGPATLSVSGLPAYALTDADGDQLQAGDLVPFRTYLIRVFGSSPNWSYKIITSISRDVHFANKSRPGEDVKKFTGDVTGSIAATTALSPSVVATDTDGAVVRLGPGEIAAPRDAFRTETGRQYQIRFVVRRRTNPTDPANDTVRLAIRWLTYTKDGVTSSGTTVLEDVDDLLIASGRVQKTFRVSSSAGDDIDAAWPAGTVYARPYVECFGASNATDIEVIEWTDLTAAVAYSPDLTALDARVGALESLDIGTRLTTIEGQLSGSEIGRYVSRAAVALATVPGDVDIIETLGYAEAGDGGAAHYLRVLSEPSHSGKVQSADGAWWEIVVGNDKILLTQLGCVGDGVTEDQVAFLAAAHTADELGLKLGSPNGKTYLLAGALDTPAVALDVSIDLDLNGSTLLAAIGDGPSLNAPFPMVQTDEADNVSVVLRNGIINGGVSSGIASSGYGDRLFNLEGGDLVWFDQMTVGNGSNRRPNVDVDANGDPDEGGAVNHLLASSYKAGDIRVHNAKRVKITECSFVKSCSEMLIVTSTLATTVLEVKGVYTSKTGDGGATLSNSWLGAFNVHPSAYIGWVYSEDFHKSMMNFLSNGGVIEHIYGDGVADSSLVDLSEVGRAYNNQTVVRHIYGKDVDASCVYVTGSQITVEDVTAVDCGRAVMVDQDLVAWDAQGDWWDGTERETAGVTIRRIRASGSTEVDIEIVGASASQPAHVVIEDPCVKPPDTHTTYGIQTTDCSLTLRGFVGAGDTALVRMTGYAKFRAERAIFAPISTASVILFHSASLSEPPVFDGCKRTTTLGGGKYDVEFSGSPVIATDKVHAILSPSITTAEVLAIIRDYGAPQFIYQLADDTVISIVPPRKAGFMLIGRNLNGTPGGNDMGFLKYNVSGSPSISEFETALSDLSVGTTALTNGTSDGVDNETNVAALSTGVLQIKNRQGVTADFMYQFLL